MPFKRLEPAAYSDALIAADFALAKLLSKKYALALIVPAGPAGDKSDELPTMREDAGAPQCD
jgi:hypothetical protein